MSSYVITGVSRGLGYEFLRQTSSDPSNNVVGIVRDRAATLEKISKDADLKDRSNIHIVQADLTDYDALKVATEEASVILGGKLDYIIANAALIPLFSAYDAIGTLGTNDPRGLEKDLLDVFKVNVIANVHLFNLLMPLIFKGTAKKVITLGTGLADDLLTAKWEVDLDSSYSISKAAMNTAVAKFSAQYSKDGVLFMTISPGVIDTGGLAGATEAEMQKRYGMYGKFAAYAPHFTGPSTAEESIKLVLNVIQNASVEKDAGSAVSHFGNKQWL